MPEDGLFVREDWIKDAKNKDIARYKSPDEIEVMRALKRALDPKNILNPGKLLP